MRIGNREVEVVVQVPSDFLKTVYNYLCTRPYGDVAVMAPQIFSALQQAEQDTVEEYLAGPDAEPNEVGLSKELPVHPPIELKKVKPDGQT